MRLERYGALPLYVAASCLVLDFCLRRPEYHFDMIAYVAAAKAFEERDPASLHRFAYAQARKSLPQEAYEFLAQPRGDSKDSEFRRTMGADPAAFAEQLPFYQIRAIYVFVVFALYKIGLNIVTSARLVAGASVAAGILLLFPMASGHLKPRYTYILPPLALVFGAMEVARMSTPDGLAFLAVVLSAYLFLKRHWGLFIILPAMIAVRTDLILYSLPLLAYLFVAGDQGRALPLASSLASVFLYWFVGWYYGNPGWGTVFCYTLVEIATHPISSPPTLTASKYLSVLAMGAKRAFLDRFLILYLLIFGYSIYLILKRYGAASTRAAWRSRVVALSLLSGLYLVLHFALFPVTWDRFFAAQYVLGGFALFAQVSELEVTSTICSSGGNDE